MPSAAYYRQQAEALRDLARTMTDENMALAYHLRAVEYDHLADEAESQGESGTQPPPTTPTAPDQPTQQQEQAQPGKEDDTE